MIHWLSLARLALCLMLTSAAQAQLESEADQAAIIGRVAFLKGEVLATNGDASRYLDAGSIVREGDTVASSQRSFAVLELLDGSRIALQSSSSIRLADFERGVGQASQMVELIRGGLRFVTGAIGRSRPEAVRVYSKNITIGIRGTTFVARLCNSADCSFEKGVGEYGRVVENTPREGAERLFRVDPVTGRRSEISRRQFDERLGNAYVGLIEGAITVRIGLDAFELQVGGDQPRNPNSGRPNEPPSANKPPPPKPPAPRLPRNKKDGAV